MAHYDTVLPGRVYWVSYERMVSDTESEVRRLLAHVGLPFEKECLQFWANRRAVRTASSEQVRQPIFGDGVDHWRNFEPWLEPLRTRLRRGFPGRLGRDSWGVGLTTTADIDAQTQIAQAARLRH